MTRVVGGVRCVLSPLQNNSAKQVLLLLSVSLCGRVDRWFRGRTCIRMRSFQDLSETEKMPAGVANQVSVYFFVCVCARPGNFPACQDCKNEPETTGPGQALARAHVYNR